MTNVSATSFGSGAKVMDLFPLPVPVFIAIRAVIYILKHWYIAAILYLMYAVGFWLSLLFAISIPIAWVVYVALNNKAHDPWAILRASTRLARTRARWRRTCEAADLNNGPKIPRLISLKRPPKIANRDGTALEFTLNLQRVAKTVSDLEEEQEIIVTVLNARRSRVQKLTPGTARLIIEWERNIHNSVIRNPKDMIEATQLPMVELDENVLLQLDTSLLVVGESGSGKSNLTWNMLSSLNKNKVPYRLHVIDPKQVELSELEHSPYTQMYVDRAKESAKVIDDFHARMEARLAWMKTQVDSNSMSLRKIQISKKHPLQILVIDEMLLMGKVLKGGDTDTNFAEILSIGRAAGFIVIANSQLGQIDTLGRIRDLFPQRVCLATKSADLTNAVLGANAEKRGARCTEITEKGVGYLYTDFNGSFTRFRPPLIENTMEIANAQGKTLHP